MEPRSEKQKIEIDEWSSAYRRSGFKRKIEIDEWSSACRRPGFRRSANDPGKRLVGGTPIDLWLLQAMTTSRWEVHERSIASSLNGAPVATRTQPGGRMLRQFRLASFELHQAI